MKTTIGGDRLGSGGKQEISAKNYSRSSHDMSYTWRSSMAAGTLVPFMVELGLPGDSWDIDLAMEGLTLPTLGPLFGSYKIQLDVFQIPIRLYNAGLHMNRLGIGMDMSKVHLPQMNVYVEKDTTVPKGDNQQVSASALIKYLGISGVGKVTNDPGGPTSRQFNAIPYLAYWDVYKNYYANKQEEKGVMIHTGFTTIQTINAEYWELGAFVANVYTDVMPYVATLVASSEIRVEFEADSEEPTLEAMRGIWLNWDAQGGDVVASNIFDDFTWDDVTKTVIITTVKAGQIGETGALIVRSQEIKTNIKKDIGLEEFPLENIDKMRDTILQYPFESGAYTLDKNNTVQPYLGHMDQVSDNDFAGQYSQEGLGIKTYQSDLLNNWISTEWIDGTNGVNEVTAVSTEGDSFTIDALNLASKVYNMLNRIAISGGTYDDWLDAVYTHERSKSVESPVYHGSLIKEMAFQEVVSTAYDTDVETGDQNPLGTLAGRGKMTGKNKGGKINVKIDEPSYIMGIVSLTPRIDYSQGNKWDVNLKTLNDLHKPALDAIGYQDLITEQMHWSDTDLDWDTEQPTYKSAGKQPAWINYMTNINKCYGDFAEENKTMFMTLNRRYELDEEGAIKDLTTYIDPEKFNYVFAETNLDAQNFWIQISNKITARRKMSAKVIPNL